MGGGGLTEGGGLVQTLLTKIQGMGGGRVRLIREVS